MSTTHVSKKAKTATVCTPGLPLSKHERGPFVLYTDTYVLEPSKEYPAYERTPIFRCLRKDANECIYINVEEAWFYELVPGLSIRTTEQVSDFCTAVVPFNTITLINILRNMRFDAQGSIHMCTIEFIRFMVSTHMIAITHHRNSTPPYVHFDNQHKNSSFKSVKLTPGYKYKKNFFDARSFYDCKVYSHVRTDTPTQWHPDGEYIAGKPICTPCFEREYCNVKASWCLLHELKHYLPEDVYDLTINKLCHKPIRFILIGMLMASTSHPNTPLTLRQYEYIGRGTLPNPARYIICLPHTDNPKHGTMSQVFGVYVWKMFNLLISKRQYRLYTSTLLENIRLHAMDSLDYFGWYSTKVTWRYNLPLVDDVPASLLYNSDATFKRSLLYILNSNTGTKINNRLQWRTKKTRFLLWGATVQGLRALALCTIEVSTGYPLVPENPASTTDIYVTLDDIEAWDVITEFRFIKRNISSEPLTRRRNIYRNIKVHITKAHCIEWHHFDTLVNTIGMTNIVLEGSLHSALQDKDNRYTSVYNNIQDHPCSSLPHPRTGGVFAILFDEALRKSWMLPSPSNVVHLKIGKLTRKFTPFQSSDSDSSHVLISQTEQAYYESHHPLPWLDSHSKGVVEKDPPTLVLSWMTYSHPFPIKSQGMATPPTPCFAD